MIDLPEPYLHELKAILRRQVPELEVRAFGSRVQHRASRYSDLDLVIVGEHPLRWQTLFGLKEALSESMLPIIVEVVDWHALSEEFRKLIEKNYEVVQEGKNRAPK
jgi:predicted nucleotidyltransferase